MRVPGIPLPAKSVQSLRRRDFRSGLVVGKEERYGAASSVFGMGFVKSPGLIVREAAGG
jgi:hypothetical protein